MQKPALEAREAEEVANCFHASPILQYRDFTYGLRAGAVHVVQGRPFNFSGSLMVRERSPLMAKKLLLVEDNLSIQHLVQIIFASEDFEVVVTNDATDGLRKIEAWIPDIILADASMPGIDGFQLCQIIRHTASVRHIPVLLLTSLFATYDVAKGTRVGVTAHLPKPFESRLLLSMLQQLVEPAAEVLTRGTIHSLPPETFATSPGDDEQVPAQELTVDVLQAAAPARDMAQNPRAPALPMADSTTPTAVPPSSLTAPGGAATTFSPPGAPEASLAAAPTFLGQEILQMLYHTLDVQMASLLEKITPQIVEAVRDVVMAQIPPLLTMLLQREIDRLKQEVDHDDPWSLMP
jgi:DNA-binding response OmpR family regulator